MISIPYSEVKFNIDKENRVVVAHCSVDMAMRFANDRNKLVDKLPGNDKWGVANSILWDLECDGRSVYNATGVARCDPEDEFDEEKGKQLALYRMMDEVYNEWLKRIFKNLDSMEAALELYKEYIDDNCHKIINDLDRRDELVAGMFE